MRVWLLLLDLDGTLWDHPDISTLKPPFKRVGELVIVDSEGVEVRAYKGMVELLRWARSNNGITSTLSWNVRDIALEALETLNLTRLFDYLMIEPHPRKDRMVKKLLEKIRSERGVAIPPCRIVYIDDRDIHVEDIYKNIGRVHFLKAWESFRNTQECILEIKEALNKC